jgi:lysophospholipase L1-like esterase
MILVRLLGVLLICGLLGSTQMRIANPANAEPGSFPVVAFIGDSYTEGAGASTPDRRWSTLVARRMGWLEMNLGEGGTGYLKAWENRDNYFDDLDEVTALRPDIVVVSGGQNDRGLLVSNPGELYAGVSHFYVQLRARLPRARIIGVGPSFPDLLTPDRYAFDQVVTDAVRAVGGQSISLLRPTPALGPMMVLPDGVHVGDAGHAAIANRVLTNMFPV